MRWPDPFRNDSHRMTYCVAVILLMCVILSGKSATGDDRQDLSEWLAKLASPRAAERRDAERLLQAAGPKILDELPQPNTIEDIAARDALVRIRHHLEVRRALAAATPGRVTSQGETSIAELLDQIALQTGNPVLRVRADANREAASALDEERLRHQVDWTRVTYWQAISEIAKPSVAPIAGADRIDDVNTAFRVRIESIEDRPYPGNDALLFRQVRLSLQCEPRLAPVFVTFRDDDLQARIRNIAVAPFSQGAVREIDFTSTGNATFDIPLLIPVAEASSPMSLSGSASVELIEGFHEFHFPHVGQSRRTTAMAPQRRGHVTAILQSVDFDSVLDELRLRMTLRYAAGGPLFESFRVASLHRTAWLEHEAGRRIPADPRVEITLEQNGAIGVQYHLAHPPEDWQAGTWVCRVPTVLTQVPVRFDTEWRPSVVLPPQMP